MSRRSTESFDASPLSPPRPFFLSQDSRRSSASETSSLSLSASDSERETNTNNGSTSPRVQQHARRRSAIASSSYAPVAPASPISPTYPATARRRTSNPFEGVFQDYAPVAGAEDADLSPTSPAGWNAASLYDAAAAEEQRPASPGARGSGSSRAFRPPPSSFQFPFQSHPGNPDPLPRRRSGSFESLTSGGDHRNASDTSHDIGAAPLRSDSTASLAAMPSPNPNSVYRNSAAASMLTPSASQTALNAAYASGHAGAAPMPMYELPRTASQTFRAPFLSPASRPGSSLWAPPTYLQDSSRSGSATALALPAPPAPAPSTRLPSKLTKEEKPWLGRAAPRARVSWWLTFACMLVGLAGAGLLCFFGFESVEKFSDSELCSVLEDNFDTFDLTNTWTREVQLGGFGNAEFQIASSFDNNSYVQNGQLYIMPTLTSAWLGTSTVESGHGHARPVQTNATACTASGNGVDQVINPVMSARITTQQHYSLTYGRVEVRAKIPRGDWLWPAIWMLPVNGTWPLDGEMDIMEARGNGPSYGAQGTNFVRSTVQYGPMSSIVKLLYGWYGMKRSSFDEGFHTYGLEWDDTWMRFYVDTRVHTTLLISTKNKKSSFWNRAGFPATAQNGSAEVPLSDPYEHNNSPFDQPFYLIIDLAVGGTSGWFPDGVGGKPWFDSSLTAMYEFYKAQTTWYPTWPQNPEDGAFRIDSVKMWKKC
ncbi:Glycoside hydrolase family 16 protein [Mycena sanguinolenta]|uniref:Glycoside hydrolase family 16 protein n=1 Tax=Mycena sanguinolenta TaxID=230812 RepID=A0A8H6ZEW3_9AGAR|nr:Glycoside hydrolase family 16 protein [Mycena sanguinolenta]